jgi:hypothetical protein
MPDGWHTHSSYNEVFEANVVGLCCVLDGKCRGGTVPAVKYLMTQGFSQSEALEYIKTLYTEGGENNG